MKYLFKTCTIFSIICIMLVDNAFNNEHTRKVAIIIIAIIGIIFVLLDLAFNYYFKNKRTHK